jgi:ribonuclease-3
VVQPDLDRLQRLLDHRFQDPSLLIQALSHRSIGAANNERFEFLGDSILNFHVAERLYGLHPDANEGQLSRSRALLVKKETLADIARDLGLGEFLRLGPGELRSGGANRESILADAVEAVVAAVYLDADMVTARRCLDRLIGDRLQTVSPHTQSKDPKTMLQEQLQGRGLGLPDYEIIETTGAEHRREFQVRCSVADLDLHMTGRGKSRKAAEQAAARALLDVLGSRA